MNKSEPTLCNRHASIKYYAREIKRFLKKQELHPEQDFSKEILERASKIVEESIAAKKQGQRMENRLRRYKNGIESLGFIRKYKK